MRLPIYIPELKEQKYSCHGCGSCCRDFTVQLTDNDVRKLNEQEWQGRLGEEFVVRFRGQNWLKQREDGACVFLGENGLCKVHAEFGLEAKPLACQFFPFMLSPHIRSTHIGISFACSSVVASKGASLQSHAQDIARMSQLLPESAPMPVRLKGNLIASELEVSVIEDALDGWLSKKTISPALRYEGLAWLVTSMLESRLKNMRAEKLRTLMNTLVDAAESELPLLSGALPQARAWRLLRQAVFARVEDPKIAQLLKRGKLATVLSQWSRSRRWMKAAGNAPEMSGFVSVPFCEFNNTAGLFHGPDAAAIDHLLQRWIRAGILGGRAWGSGLYGLPIDQGLGLIMVNVLSVMWLARFRAAGRGEKCASLADVEMALGRVDRTSGRAVWLASQGERLRVQWLSHSDSLRLLARALV